MAESAVAVLNVKADVQRLAGKVAAAFIPEVDQDFQLGAGFLVLVEYGWHSPDSGLLQTSQVVYQFSHRFCVYRLSNRQL